MCFPPYPNLDINLFFGYKLIFPSWVWYFIRAICLFVCGFSLTPQGWRSDLGDEVPMYRSGTLCLLYSAASLGKHVIGPHANPPSHIILTPGRPVMFHGPHFMQAKFDGEL